MYTIYSKINVSVLNIGMGIASIDNFLLFNADFILTRNRIPNDKSTVSTNR